MTNFHSSRERPGRTDDRQAQIHRIWAINNLVSDDILPATRQVAVFGWDEELDGPTFIQQQATK